MAREAGARNVYFASAAPPVRYANVYGIDMPSRSELIASGRSDDEIRREIGADALVYQDLDGLKAALAAVNPDIACFETSCFDGHYITGDVTREYLSTIESARRDGSARADDEGEGTQLDLNLVASQ